MGIEALTHSDDGTAVLPVTDEDWGDRVSATRTRNYVLGDPLLDWLDLYGEQKGFQQDKAFGRYDPRTDFTKFIFEQGRRFETAVVDLLRQDCEVRIIATERGDARDLRKAEETFAAMSDGVPIIHQGVLRDPEHRTYGMPDLLVRSDVLAQLFPGSIDGGEVANPAQDLSVLDGHYRVVDVKFRTLGFLAAGDLNNSGSAPSHKVQLFIYNRALGRVQGYEPPIAYVLGRGWTQGNRRGSNCLERLGPVPTAGTLANKRLVSEATDDAVDWVRRVRRDGQDWAVLPEPTLPELYPNGGNSENAPWHHAVARIAEQLEDLTLLWNVAETGRRKGHEAGIYRWTDPGITPEAVGVTGSVRPMMLAEIIDVNRATDGPVVRPRTIRADKEEWHGTPSLEFYVDFETVNDLADDFTRLPEKGGQPLIFMIGCGHIEDGRWSFKSFVVDALTEDDEAGMIDGWLSHMEAVRQRLAPGGDAPKVIHWSPAEVTNFESAYNSARNRHDRQDWPALPWFDFLRRVMHDEPVVIKGALAFGLKAVAKAMHSHGLIETLWSDGPTDGLGAMVAAWSAQDEAYRTGQPMSKIDLMGEVVQYNEVDCKVMMEIVRYLRANH